jgi:hypothetical protein
VRAAMSRAMYETEIRPAASRRPLRRASSVAERRSSIGNVYFVLDGHHRVSVASYHGVEWIDAYVTEFGGGTCSERGDRECA